MKIHYYISVDMQVSCTEVCSNDYHSWNTRTVQFIVWNFHISILFKW